MLADNNIGQLASNVCRASPFILCILLRNAMIITCDCVQSKPSPSFSLSSIHSTHQSGGRHFSHENPHLIPISHFSGQNSIVCIEMSCGKWEMRSEHYESSFLISHIPHLISCISQPTFSFNYHLTSCFHMTS